MFFYIREDFAKHKCIFFKQTSLTVNADELFIGVQALVNLPYFEQLCNSLSAKSLFLYFGKRNVLLIHLEFGFSRLKIR